MDSLNRALWRHACASSDLLFRQSGSLAWLAISCFSARQSSQFSCPGLYGGTTLKISHLMFGFGFSFLFQTSVDNAVAFLLLSHLKLFLCPLYLVLKLFVEPMYTLSFPSTLMVALYTTGFWHEPCTGHWSFFLQLQGASIGSLLQHSTFLLCACSIVRMFFVQLYESFIVFLLHTLYSVDPGLKCFLTSTKNFRPILVTTLLLNGGLNQIIFLLFVFLLVLGQFGFV